MNQLISHSADNIRHLIRDSFFLKPDSVVSDELVSLFVSAQALQQFDGIAAHTQHQHTDTFSIYMTHDIDWLNPLHPYSILNYVRSCVSGHRWLTASQLLQGDLFLRCIEQMLTIEQNAGIHAVYHIGATNRKSLQRYGIRYNQSDTRYSELIKLLQSYNQTIGLHSSFDADAAHQIHNEQLQLEHYTAQPVVAHRSHFLHANHQSLFPQLEAAGIRYEFGHGEARKVGLINHFPGKYKPVNPLSGRVFNITVVPLILLDNVFFVKPYHEVLQAFKTTLNHLKQYNGSACILFHPENMLLKPQLWNYFEEIIHICTSEGAVFNPSIQQP